MKRRTCQLQGEPILPNAVVLERGLITVKKSPPVDLDCDPLMWESDIDDVAANREVRCPAADLGLPE